MKLGNLFVTAVLLVGLSAIGSVSPAEAKPGNGIRFVTDGLEDSIGALERRTEEQQQEIDELSGVATAEILVDCDAGGVLQDAIDAALSNTTIRVEGTCNENINIGPSKRSLVIDGQGSASIHADDGRVVFISGVGITIRGFNTTGSINGGGRGIVVSNSASVTIDSNDIRNAETTGIAVEGHSFATIVSNIVRSNGGNGIAIAEGSAARIGTNCDFDNLNLIIDNGQSGVALSEGSEATIRGNTIRGNGTNGIFVTDSSVADAASNDISGNGDDGVDVRRGSSVRMGRQDRSGCINDPNQTSSKNGGVGIDCSSLSTVDGELGTLDGELGAAMLRNTNAVCPNCCFTSLDPPVSAPVQVFVTSLSFDGNFPGLAGADASCTTAANNAGRAGTWTAWLSDNTTDAVDRIFDAGTEYQLVDGTVIANNLADLLDGTLDSPINVDETGTTIPGAAEEVWTGTGTDGTFQGSGLCVNWTVNTNTNQGRVGDRNATDANWTDVGGGNNCDLFNRLYCFADGPMQ